MFNTSELSGQPTRSLSFGSFQKPSVWTCLTSSSMKLRANRRRSASRENGRSKFLSPKRRSWISKSHWKSFRSCEAAAGYVQSGSIHIAMWRRIHLTLSTAFSRLHQSFLVRKLMIQKATNRGEIMESGNCSLPAWTWEISILH